MGDCIADHFALLQGARYSQALQFRDDVLRYAYEIVRAGYATADHDYYADTIDKIAKMIQKA